jgi:anaerobic selenocysteine-containing dehydrogenase
MEKGSPAQYKKTMCPLDCPDSCGILAKVVDNRVVSLAGDPEHGYTNGVICRKMRSYHERVYGDERILHPMVRTGKKGSGEFRRISMKEAIRLFAAKLKETKEAFGGEAILPYQYAGNMGVLNRNGGYALYNKLGTSRTIETICSAAAGKGWSLHCSSIPGSPPEVASESSLIVAWGINVRVSNMHFWRYIAEARKKGAKLVVVDPAIARRG